MLHLPFLQINFLKWDKEIRGWDNFPDNFQESKLYSFLQKLFEPEMSGALVMIKSQPYFFSSRV